MVIPRELNFNQITRRGEGQPTAKTWASGLVSLEQPIPEIGNTLIKPGLGLESLTSWASKLYEGEEEPQYQTRALGSLVWEVARQSNEGKENPLYPNKGKENPMQKPRDGKPTKTRVSDSLVWEVAKQPDEGKDTHSKSPAWQPNRRGKLRLKPVGCLDSLVPGRRLGLASPEATTPERQLREQTDRVLGLVRLVSQSTEEEGRTSKNKPGESASLVFNTLTRDRMALLGGMSREGMPPLAAQEVGLRDRWGPAVHRDGGPSGRLSGSG
ncbi:hypothetical protein EAI_02258 [Harpegnathos saltator]|uniref:Uncharacterized protein n=1 Tax=Harpegnathos saltator TaxID=610380 RepID=E2C7W4_HARSA|nr:hypothetical protein EAI_02258 [Harpegnathos saltator]